MKTKALISCAVTAQLICVFVFAYAKSRFSHDTAHISKGKTKIPLREVHNFAKGGGGNIFASLCKIAYFPFVYWCGNEINQGLVFKLIDHFIH